MPKNPIIIEQTFNCAAPRLWQAITHVDEMRQWFFDNIPNFRAEIGFETRFMVDAGERQFMHVWKIVDVKEEALIKYQWIYEGYEGIGFVTFKITDGDGVSLLTVISEGLDSYKPQVLEFTRESCALGWKYFINERLKSYIAKAIR
ncbi:SRPBCC domain-containing protein [Carboxylicivirga sp. A043]|uniref:SRPBCC family protein n=1 Tax=Carboxylicivirga litoralis TaxID=2816963 RepID=UPI0021CB53A6|nr:SRPBCC domain-containing protein [Carboxylicivirga sp. A043]MCU4155991.1 SRPBCC domain-containing protein [Carboxylicivirga sp. A043]